MANDESPEAPDADDLPRATIGYDLIKSHYFRVIWAEGAFGGVSPSGHINMSLFNERFPLPTHVEHTLAKDGLGPEIQTARVQRDGIVREVETEVVLSLNAAKRLHAWLGEKIAALESVTEKIALVASAKGSDQ